MIGDYDAGTGGVNPLLGMASGGAYGNIDFAVTPRLTVSAGYTERRMRRDARYMNPQDLLAIGPRLEKNDAQHIAITYRPLDALTLNASMTRLQEDKALLGVASVDPNDFGTGATSNAVTVGGDVAIGAGFGFGMSATKGQTRNAGNSYRNLSIADGGIGTSAYEIALSKAHLVDATDRLRVSLSQPLHVDSGTLNFSSVQVVDRQTGELGVVTQSFAVPGPARQLVGSET